MSSEVADCVAKIANANMNDGNCAKAKEKMGYPEIPHRSLVATVSRLELSVGRRNSAYFTSRGIRGHPLQ